MNMDLVVIYIGQGHSIMMLLGHAGMLTNQIALQMLKVWRKKLIEIP